MFGATSTVLFFGTATILAATADGGETLAVMVELAVPPVALSPAVSDKATVSQGVRIGMQTPLVFWWPGGHSQPPLEVLTNVGMHVTSTSGNRHCSVVSPVTSVKDAFQLPVKLRFPDADAAFDALASAGVNRTGANNGVAGVAWSSPSLVPVGRAAVPTTVTLMRDTMPVAVSLVSAMFDAGMSPQWLQLATPKESWATRRVVPHML